MSQHTRTIMLNLNVISLKPFIPAKDFDVSIQFYKRLGFELKSQDAGIAFFRYQTYTFLLQDFYEPQHCENYMMHLQVADVNAWHEHILTLNLEQEFNCKVTPIVTQPWGMTEFCLLDPSKVLWRIAQNN